MGVRTKRAISQAIVAYAKKNSLVIHPGIGYGYFVDNLLLLGNCACAPERKGCPCPEAKEEVATDGKCKCGLYWKDLDAYTAWDPEKPTKRIMKGG